MFYLGKLRDFASKNPYPSLKLSEEDSLYTPACHLSLLYLNIKGLAGCENVLTDNPSVSMFSPQVDSRRSSTELPAPCQSSKQLFDQPGMSPISEISSPSSMVSHATILEGFNKQVSCRFSLAPFLSI